MEAAFLDATRAGTAVSDVLAAGTAAYGKEGLDAAEWRRHHQGGPTGYLSRDHLATPSATELVEDFRHSPGTPASPGSRWRTPCCATPAGVEILTVDPDWPAVEVVRPSPARRPRTPLRWPAPDRDQDAVPLGRLP